MRECGRRWKTENTPRLCLAHGHEAEPAGQGPGGPPEAPPGTCTAFPRPPPTPAAPCSGRPNCPLTSPAGPRQSPRPHAQCTLGEAGPRHMSTHRGWGCAPHGRPSPGPRNRPPPAPRARQPTSLETAFADETDEAEAAPDQVAFSPPPAASRGRGGGWAQRRVRGRTPCRGRGGAGA